jgi:DNA invertase Pin-like site-specific DNA recombinase
MKRLTKKQIAEIKTLRRQGLKLREIQDKTGHSSATVSRHSSKMRRAKTPKNSKDAQPLYGLILESDLPAQTKIDLLKKLV